MPVTQTPSVSMLLQAEFPHWGGLLPSLGHSKTQLGLSLTGDTGMGTLPQPPGALCWEMVRDVHEWLTCAHECQNQQPNRKVRVPSSAGVSQECTDTWRTWILHLNYKRQLHAARKTFPEAAQHNPGCPAGRAKLKRFVQRFIHHLPCLFKGVDGEIKISLCLGCELGSTLASRAVLT